MYQESGGIGEPSDETVSEEKLKVSNNPVNGYFLSAQSGNTGGLTWAAPVATSCTGNSATATALATARAINGVNFDGTAAITVTAAAGTLSGTTLNSSVVTSFSYIIRRLVRAYCKWQLFFKTYSCSDR